MFTTLVRVESAGRSSRRLAAPIATLVVAAGLALPASSSAGVSARSLSEPAAEVRAYWTAERMRSARPASELLAGVAAPNDLLAGMLGGGQPTRRSAARPVEDASKAPFRTHGKVYFRLASGDFQCSATSVRARTKRLVVTAGHCVHGNGDFASKWMFVPGKKGAGRERPAEPYGRWTAARLATTQEWKRDEDLRYDVGMATMKKRNGKRLQRVVGARGIAFRKGRDLHFKAFGYPAEGRFDGNRLYGCSSAAEGTDSGPRPRPTRIDCDMTAGSSGGGWIIGKGRVNSVVSYGYECVVGDLLCPLVGGNPEEGKLFGPYFGNKIRRLYLSQRG